MSVPFPSGAIPLSTLRDAVDRLERLIRKNGDHVTWRGECMCDPECDCCVCGDSDYCCPDCCSEPDVTWASDELADAKANLKTMERRRLEQWNAEVVR